MKCLGIHLGSIEMSTQPLTPTKHRLCWNKKRATLQPEKKVFHHSNKGIEMLSRCGIKHFHTLFSFISLAFTGVLVSPLSSLFHPSLCLIVWLVFMLNNNNSHIYSSYLIFCLCLFNRPYYWHYREMLFCGECKKARSKVQTRTDRAVWGQNQGWILGLKVIGVWGQPGLDRNKMGWQAEMERMGDPPKTNTQEVKSSNLLGAKCYSVVYNNLVMSGEETGQQICSLWSDLAELSCWGEGKREPKVDQPYLPKTTRGNGKTQAQEENTNINCKS